MQAKDKHIRIPEDSELLKAIQKKVRENLDLNHPSFTPILWAKAVIYTLLSIVAYIGLFLINDPFWFVVCFIGYGYTTLLLAFNFSHDFSHNTVFKQKKWNNLGFTIIYTLVGAHAEAWKQRHVHAHHYAPNVQEYDSDLKISSIMRLSPEAELKWFHRYQHIYGPLAYTSYSLFWIFIKDFVILYSEDEFTGRKDFRYHLVFWLQKSFYLTYLLILPLLFSGMAWSIVVTGFLLMHLFQSVFLLLTFLMTHHVENTHYPETDSSGHIQASWVMNQISSSNDMHPFSPIANFILGGFNNHIAHHLFPHIHHIHYPRLNRILYPLLEEYGIKANVTTWWGGVKSHLRLLRRMGIRANCLHRVETAVQ